MSHFYATIPQSARKTPATARGHKHTGISTIAASWSGSIQVTMFHDPETGKDVYTVDQLPWHGQGVSRRVASGIVGEDNATLDSGPDKAETLDTAAHYFAQLERQLSNSDSIENKIRSEKCGQMAKLCRAASGLAQE